jgi:hypothetical protein
MAPAGKNSEGVDSKAFVASPVTGLTLFPANPDYGAAGSKE